MRALGARFSWWAGIAVYWLIALWLLCRVCPIYVEPAGPSSSFYWGTHPPSPTMSEFNRSITVRLSFLYPYLCAASIIAVAGGIVTPWLARRWKARRLYAAMVSSALNLGLLLLVCVASDIGTALHVWRGPTLLQWESVGFLLKLLVPVSLLAGVLAALKNRQPEAAQ